VPGAPTGCQDQAPDAQGEDPGDRERNQTERRRVPRGQRRHCPPPGRWGRGVASGLLL